jgi:hypothetical protein
MGAILGSCSIRVPTPDSDAACHSQGRSTASELHKTESSDHRPHGVLDPLQFHIRSFDEFDLSFEMWLSQMLMFAHVLFFEPLSVLASLVPTSISLSILWPSSGQCPRGAAVTLCVCNDFWPPFWHRFFDVFSKMAKVWNPQRAVRALPNAPRACLS